jgi:hypothetical protein
MTRSRYDYGSEGVATQDFIPDTDNAYDLGSSTKEFKDLYLDGVAYLDKVEISPQGAAVPTASSLAIQDNSTSGDIVYIMSTPAASGTADIVTIEANNNTWTGGNVLYLISGDSNCNFLRCTNAAGASERFTITQAGNVEMAGDLEFIAGGSITTSSNGNLTLLPNGTGITIIGDAGTTSHSLASNDDLFVTGKFEVDGAAYFDSTVEISRTLTILPYGNSSSISFSDGTNSTVLTAKANTDEMILALSSAHGRHMVIGDRAHVNSDHDHANQTNPTIFIHSVTDPDTSNTQWISLTHDQTDGVIATGLGNVHVTPASGGALSVGTDGTLQGILELWDGASGNTPAYIKIHSPNGTAWYLFVEDDGTIKVHNAAPTQNSDGSVVGAQT